MAARESKTGITIERIKGGLLYGKLTIARGEAAPIPDEELIENLFAAEDFYEDTLDMRWQTTRVFSSPELRAGLADPDIARPVDFSDYADVSIPAFDYEPGMMGDPRWSSIQLPYRPIQSVSRVFFWQPGLTVPSIWKIPANWWRLDKRFGRIEFLPSSGPTVATFGMSSALLNVFSGGHRIPQAIFIDYVTGFTPDQLEHNERHLLRGVALLTTLFTFGMVSSNATAGAQSGSLSLDGLSRSRSFGGKYGAYSAEIELAMDQEKEIRSTWKQKNQGIQMDFA